MYAYMFWTMFNLCCFQATKPSQCGSTEVDLVNAAYGDAFDEFQGLREDRRWLRAKWSVHWGPKTSSDFGRITMTGWWFGCHFLHFPIYWEFHHPNWLSYFSEGFKPPTRWINEFLSAFSWKADWCGCEEYESRWEECQFFELQCSRREAWFEPGESLRCRPMWWKMDRRLISCPSCSYFRHA